MGPWILIAGCVMVAAAALLPLRRALFAAAALLLAVGFVAQRIVSGMATAALSPLAAACAFLVVVLIRHLAEQRRQAQRLLGAERMVARGQAEAAADLERTRIARDLHDGLAHHLSGLLLQVQAAQALLDDGELAGASSRMHSSVDLARQCLIEARDVVGVLRTGSTDLKAVRTIVSDWVATTGRRVDVSLPSGGMVLDGSRWGALVATLRESLTNISRHSSSRKVVVQISDSAAGLRLSVTDSCPDRVTVRAPGEGGGHGLVGLAERAALLGGTLYSHPHERGWQLVLLLPPPAELVAAEQSDSTGAH